MNKYIKFIISVLIGSGVAILFGIAFWMIIYRYFPEYVDGHAFAPDSGVVLDMVLTVAVFILTSYFMYKLLGKWKM